MQMEQYNEYPVANSRDLVASLSRVAPNLELVRVAANFVHVFPAVESVLYLQVVATVVVVEEQVVV